MNREVHVRFCEGARGEIPRAYFGKPGPRAAADLPARLYEVPDARGPRRADQGGALTGAKRKCRG
jgi:hypothetical protein